jgi:hypothetical protein
MKDHWQKTADYFEEGGEGKEGLLGRSKYNAAGLVNLSLERNWTRVFQAQSTKNLPRWNAHLDSIWLILGGDSVPNSPIVKEFEQIEKKIGESGSLYHNVSGFQKQTDSEKEKISYQYRLLMEKSLFLRRLQNKQGKGTAYVDEDEDEID